MVIVLLVVHKLVHVCLICMFLIMSASGKRFTGKLVLSFMAQGCVIVVVVYHVCKDGVEIGIRVASLWTAERWTGLGMHQSGATRRAGSLVKHSPTSSEERRVEVHACAEHGRVLWR
jgi:hypothetical protein